MRQLSNRRTDPFMLIQDKYPWPSPFGDNFMTHSEMLHRRLAHLKKIHAEYRRRS